MAKFPFTLPDKGKTDAFNPDEFLSFIWKIPYKQETEPGRVEIALRERIKELNCLYGIALLAEQYYDSMEDFLRCLVEVLPLAWQYPECACSRIVFRDRTYKSSRFRISKWRQVSQIHMYSEPVGEVAIFYLEEKQPADEGPFLREERVLLDEIARRISATAIRVSAEQELQEMNKQLNLERTALQEANAVLKTVLSNIEEEKKRIYRDMQVNVDKVITPLLNALSMEMPKPQRKYVDILRNNLEEITSPFTNNLLRKYHSLTPTEITVCNMIKIGMRTKEIAEMKGLSTATIHRHREHIRRKLGITNMKSNLTTVLQSI
jgi:DNA-binding CsgD family transcriptional regulator